MSPYLVGAYAAMWLLPFTLLVSLWARQRRIEVELALLRVRLEERERADGEGRETAEQ